MGLSGVVAHYSYKLVKVASVLALFTVYIAAPARADDAFTVDKVTVDAASTDANDARTKALGQGEQDAFKQLITRLAPASAADIIAKTPPSQISSMVRGFEVGEEKMTQDHYHADLRYHFLPQAVQALLPPPPTATPAAPTATTPVVVHNNRKAILVVPVLNEGRGIMKLWQDDNKWRTIWYEAALESGNGLVVVPIGDINDRVDVDDTNAAAATSQSLSRLYDRYGVGEIDMLEAFYNLKADPKPALEVTVRRLSPSLTPGPGDTSHLSYTIRTTETPETLMARAANDIARNIYKQQTIDKTKIEFARQKEINARVNVSSVDEWVQVRKHLLTHGNIVGIRLTSITNTQTFMVITYKGTPDMLGKTLVASGLRVMQDGDSLVLALR